MSTILILVNSDFLQCNFDNFTGGFTKRHVNNFLAGILIVALIGIQYSIGYTKDIQAIENQVQVEAAILNENWAKVADLLSSVNSQTTSPVLRLIKAHAYLALNRNNESLCLFSGISSKEDFRQWQKWSQNFADQNPRKAIAYYFKGDALARLRLWDSALKSFTHALELHPNHALILNARGVTYTAKKVWNLALIDFYMAISVNPSFADAYASYGNMYIQKNAGAEEAIEAFNKALDISHDFTLALNGRASVRTVLGEWDKAKDDFKKAIKHKKECLSMVTDAVNMNLSQLLNKGSKAVSKAIEKIAKIKSNMSLDERTKIIKNLSSSDVALLKGIVKQGEEFVSAVSTLLEASETTFSPNIPNFFAINKLESGLDLQVPGQGPSMNIVRYYLLNSWLGDGPLGFGWTHNYLMYIAETKEGIVIVFTPDGRWAFFKPKDDGTYEAPKGDFRTLTKMPDQTFQLKNKFGSLFYFDTAGALKSINDSNGNKLKLNYDENKRLHTLVDASGQVIAFKYDQGGRITVITDPMERKVFYNYDGEGNLVSVKNSAGFVTKYTYDDKHNLTSVIYPSGRQRFFVTDSNGRLKKVYMMGSNNSLSYQYNDAASEVVIKDALDNRSVYTYKDNLFFNRTIDPFGGVTVSIYDTNFNLISVEDALGNKISFTYDDRGNVLTVKDTLREVASYTYSPVFNKVTSVTDVKKRTTTFDYDDKGNLVKVIYPDGSNETYTYDSFGNMSSKIDRMNKKINYTYDNRGLLKKIFFPEGSSSTFTYDYAGNMLYAKDENGTISFDYDDLYRLIRVTYPSGEIVSYTYNGAGGLASVTYPDGMVINYIYDKAGKVTQINASDQTIVRYYYDNSTGWLIQHNLGNTIHTTYQYDIIGQLVDLINRNPANKVLSHFSYTYNKVGNRVTMTNQNRAERYIYDDLNHLIQVDSSDSISTTYELDALGNRIRVTGKEGKTSYSVNELNQYKEVGGNVYTYDLNGNLLHKETPSGTTTYTYNSKNQLAQVRAPTETITYIYDIFGRRISKTTSEGTTRYIYDGNRVIMEKNENGKVKATYIFGNALDEVLVMKRGEESYYYSYDGLGSVNNLTDNRGNIKNSYRYDAYGKLDYTGSIENPYSYTGREYEPETGLYYYRARYYDPSIGRFLTPDPIGFLGEMNLYSYVGSNPVNGNDPLGLITGILGPVMCGRSTKQYLDQHIKYIALSYSQPILRVFGFAGVGINLSVYYDRTSDTFYLARGVGIMTQESFTMTSSLNNVSTGPNVSAQLGLGNVVAGLSSSLNNGASFVKRLSFEGGLTFSPSVPLPVFRDLPTAGVFFNYRVTPLATKEEVLSYLSGIFEKDKHYSSVGYQSPSHSKRGLTANELQARDKLVEGEVASLQMSLDFQNSFSNRAHEYKRTMNILNKVHPNIPAKELGTLGKFSGSGGKRRYGKPAHSVPGGVSTEEIGEALVDKGNWNVISLYGLLYHVETHENLSVGKE